MRLLIFDNGTRGKYFKKYFERTTQVTLITEFKNTDLKGLEEYLSQIVTKKDFVINLVDVQANQMDLLGMKPKTDSQFFNSFFPHVLARVCHSKSCYMIHVSTNRVFSLKESYARFYDIPNCDTTYGMEKFLGEPGTMKNVCVIRAHTFDEFDFQTIKNKVLIEKEKVDTGDTTLSDTKDSVEDQKNPEITANSNLLMNGISTLQLAKEIRPMLTKFKPGTVHFKSFSREKKKDYISEDYLYQLVAENYGLKVTVKAVSGDYTDYRLEGEEAERSIETQVRHLFQFDINEERKDLKFEDSDNEDSDDSENDNTLEPSDKVVEKTKNKGIIQAQMAGGRRKKIVHKRKI